MLDLFKVGSPQPEYPAEWQHHAALWLAWPHDRAEWGDYFDGACHAIDLLIRELIADSDSEPIALLVPEIQREGPPALCKQWKCSYGDIWLRDTLPMFVREQGRVLAQIYEFNGWGGKYIFAGDKELAQVVAEYTKHETRHFPYVLEGGALDGNGAGTILSTRQCLLNQNRNLAMTEQSWESVLSESLGTKKIIWIERGLVGDHTDGHVDNIARFVGESQVVCTRASVRGETNEEIYKEVKQTLRNARTADGNTLDIVQLPSPGIVEGPEGIMPASYCNFLVTNRCVVVPVFDVPSDKEALSILSSLFPNRRMVAIPSFALLTGGGTVHCISKEEPGIMREES